MLLETDKVKGNLLEVYRQAFADLKEPISLLELGIDKGGSLLMWQSWFPKSQVVGLDIKAPDEMALHLLGEHGIHIALGCQANTELLTWLCREFGPFDVIIDDCSHRGDLTRTSFWFLFDHLRRGGFYCIEDWGTGYWDCPDYDGRKYEEANHAAGMIGFIKELVDEVGARSITDKRFGIPPERGSKFAYMTIHPGVVIVRKA
jgi:hypothetical protein